MNNLAIIPARSGSKGLKDKNIKLLNNQPLISYTIDAANKTGIFSHVMVSTDSKVYADIAQKYGAEVPFLRSKDNSCDVASSWDVVKEVLREYAKLGITFDTVALLQPTSPLRSDKDIMSAYKLFKEKKASAIISVCEMEHSPLWCNTLTDDLSMNNFLTNANNRQRQAFKKYYRINGAIYIVNVKSFLENSNIYNKNSFAYIMTNNSSIDIDTEFDFRIAEFLMSERNK